MNAEMRERMESNYREALKRNQQLIKKQQREEKTLFVIIMILFHLSMIALIFVK